jgi:DNA-binding GntR family transcriptional regulator
MASEPVDPPTTPANGTVAAPPTAPFDAVTELRIDRDSDVPLHVQIARQLEEAIVSGRLPPGERIPNELDLVDDLGLSRPTLRQAIAYLVERGLVVRKRGVGTQVVMSQVRRPLQLSSLYDDLSAAGQRPSTQVLGLDTIGCDDVVAVALGLTHGDPVVRLRRLRSAGGEPIAVMTNYLPPGIAELDESSLAQFGLYALLRRAGVHLRVANQTIGAATADPTQAALLHEPAGAALLTMTRTAFDDTGAAVEHGRHVYRASRYSVELTLVER